MEKKNNVKFLTWKIFSGSTSPVTVSQIKRALPDIPHHSIYSALESLKSDKLIIEIPSRAGKTYKRADILSQESRALHFLMRNKGTGYRCDEIASLINSTRPRAYAVLQSLFKGGFINRIGGNRLVVYYFGDELSHSSNLFYCAKCGKETFHKRGSTGRVICTVCGKQRKNTT